MTPNDQSPSLANSANHSTPLITGRDLGTGSRLAEGNVQKRTCDDDNPCTADQVVAESCEHEPVVDGSTCDADDVSLMAVAWNTVGTAHIKRALVGRSFSLTCDSSATLVMNCDDGNPCTDDTCEEAHCVHVRMPDGQTCGDSRTCGGGVCTSKCAERACSACLEGNLYYYDSCGRSGDLHEACVDGNPCTKDACVGESCLFVPLPDGANFQQDHVCQGGFCGSRVQEGRLFQLARRSTSLTPAATQEMFSMTATIATLAPLINALEVNACRPKTVPPAVRI